MSRRAWPQLFGVYGCRCDAEGWNVLKNGVTFQHQRSWSCDGTSDLDMFHSRWHSLSDDRNLTIDLRMVCLSDARTRS